MKMLHTISNLLSIFLIGRLYLLLLAFFTVFRLFLFFSTPDRLSDLNLVQIFYAFFMGVRFDTVIAGYVLALPLLLLSVVIFIDRIKPFVLRFIFWYFFLFVTIVFFLSIADIPFFNQFFARFNITALEWIDSPKFVVSMIFQEWRYVGFVGLYVLVMAAFYVSQRLIFKKAQNLQKTDARYALKAGASIMVIFVLFLGIRGRIDEKSPIRVGTAYFSENAFLNQLGLNPTFTFIRSLLDASQEQNKPIALVDGKKALTLVQQSLNIKQSDLKHPLARKIKANKPANYQNVVLVLMESMSANNMARNGNTKNLTPFLDKLANESLYFENTYTAGIHTFNGVFSTLFSFPAIFRQHPMKESGIIQYNGIADTLKKVGYQTFYFTTHDGQFDNIEGFLRANSFDHIITKSNYPSDKIKTTLGVSDDYMFEFGIPYLNERRTNNKPFLAVFLTASNHGPYYIPDYFKPSADDTKEQVVQYADWSLKKFIQLAKKEAWYKNTLFVFIADHGAALDLTYDIPLSYVHSPLIMYDASGKVKPSVVSKMAGQIDVFPTIMGLLNMSYSNNTMGIDLLSESRPYIFFNGDDKFGAIDQKWLFIQKKDGSGGLYDYRKKERHNYAAQHKEVFDKMLNYTNAHLQTYQDLLRRPSTLYVKQTNSK